MRYYTVDRLITELQNLKDEGKVLGETFVAVHDSNVECQAMLEQISIRTEDNAPYDKGDKIFSYVNEVQGQEVVFLSA